MNSSTIVRYLEKKRNELEVAREEINRQIDAHNTVLMMHNYPFPAEDRPRGKASAKIATTKHGFMKRGQWDKMIDSVLQQLGPEVTTADLWNTLKNQFDISEKKHGAFYAGWAHYKKHHTTAMSVRPLSLPKPSKTPKVKQQTS